MIKKFFKAMTVAIFAIIAGYNVYLANAENTADSDLLLANVEALSQNEEIGGITCSADCKTTGVCWLQLEAGRCKFSGKIENTCVGTICTFH